MFRYSMYRIPKLVLQVPALPQREYVGMQTLKPPFLPSKCDPELTKRSDQTGLKSYTNNVKQKTQNKLSSKTQIQNKLNSKTQIRLKSDSTRTSTHTQGASCLLNLRLAFMSSTQSCLSLLVPWVSLELLFEFSICFPCFFPESNSLSFELLANLSFFESFLSRLQDFSFIILIPCPLLVHFWHHAFINPESPKVASASCQQKSQLHCHFTVRHVQNC